MPKLWKLFGNSSSSSKNNNNNNNNKNDRNTNSNTSSNTNLDNNNNNDNNEILSITELNNHKKDRKSIIQEENENINSEDPSSHIHNRLVLQEFVELQKGIIKEVVYLSDSEPKDVLMKVDLLGVHILDKENPKALIKDFEVEQIIQYSYERDKQYLTLSYMNSEFSVESYDFVTPDYFEIFDFIGHVIAMVIKMNNQKYETEEEVNDSDDLNDFQLPKISSIYKSNESINIFSPTFILSNFIPENNTTSEGYINNGREDINNSSLCIPNKEIIHENVTNDKNIINSNKELKGSVDDIIKKENKTNIDKFIEMNNEGTESSSSTPNLQINTNTQNFDNEFRRNYNYTGSKSAVEGKTSLSDAFGFDRDSRVLGYKRLGGDTDSNENIDNRNSYQCRTIRHINSGKFDISEIPAYGKKYGTIHFRKSHDFDEIYASELILNTDNMKDQADKNNEDSNNQTQAKINIMKYFSENKSNVDKKKSYSIGVLTDNKDENENYKLSKPGKLKGKDSEDDFSINIDSSKDTIETTNENDKKKNKNKMHISKTNINKTSEEYSPSVISLDENDSSQKNLSQKKSKLKYNFYRPKSLQLNFLSSNKDSSKKRISNKNLSDCNDIFSPSLIDGENSLDVEKMSKNQKRKSNVRKSKKSFLLSKKHETNEEQEKQNNAINENQIISEEDPESNKKKEKCNNTVQYYNALTDEIEEKPVENLKNLLYGLPKLPSSSSEVGNQGGKNELDLLSSYIEAYSSSPGSKIYSTAVSTIKSQNDSRLSKTYPKELINSLNDSVFSPISDESNFDYFVNENNWKNNIEQSTIASLENDDQQDSKSLKYYKKTRSVSDMKSNTIDSKYISNIRSMNYSYKSEDIMNLDLNIIKDQCKYSSIKSASCINEGSNDRNINQNEDNGANNQHQQLHKYKNKQVINYRTIHGVSPFVSQGNNSTMLSCYNQLNSDRNSNKGKQSYNDIYSTLKKFVGKNQKTKTSINEINFVDGAPDSEDNKLPKIEKEYENGKEYLIRTLKDNHYEVTAGTVHALINEMILNNTTDIMFIDIFLLTYRHFLKANDLILLLTDEYNKLINKIDENENNESNNDVNLQIQKY
ncbi:hypothetical protein LY90DRAFT_123760 [Neocallimastix californiae]|uniref:N-terminal Ras-GEF domain-containing protein n=1 Tax=Neocallimastix californiae TaxID=1754190 RepID=A0A1Y2ALS4_9FUNG|nr:hypothetical protein LY90DRAFT_123760 [Neocallimastix californiae]|eukprot:ORY23523.1 hypothetical protein LY90DRAFT_123760 [Neocallimastix californiae]